ncbi:hypothetical protein H9X75_08345 [Fusobacterium mortiferum]|uniref:hypothetical protein n=1 Tax=uncultured Fusobacterium sp. TaxID=159267 RepID=UPI001958F781|nr:hypothetical protein [uncultured Fusobacterium sp.]MBM6691071.1 hypothetical protein [Fusobacterium mortiferum]
MEKYLITKEEKENYLKEYPVLECENSIGIDYDGYISIKCKKIAGTCTYKTSTKNEYHNCKLLNK